MAWHDEGLAPDSIHQVDFVSATDPAIDADNRVTAHKRWLDTSTTPYTAKIRNAANDGWVTIAGPGTYAPLASPALTGTPTIDGAAVATEDYVDTAVAGVSGGMAVTAESTTARTLALTDANDYIRCTNAGAVAVTVPPNSSVAFPVGTTVHVEQAGAGAVTITPDTGVTINKHADFTLVTDGQYAVASITKVDTDTWTAYGKLVPA